MTDPTAMLTEGARRIADLLGRYVAARRQQQDRRLGAIRELHKALLEIDADYRTMFGDLAELLEDIAAEPDRTKAKQRMREATQGLRSQRESYDAARIGIRAQARNLMLFTEDPQTRYYLWALVGYMLDENPGLGFPTNVPAAIETLLARDVGALTRTPSSVVLKALEDGSTPDQVLAVIADRRVQMKRFLDYAIETHAYLLARDLK